MDTLTDEDFTRMYQYIQSHYGIDLHKKKQLIVSRLTNVISLQGYDSFHTYTDDIVNGRRPDLISSMLGKLTTNYTYFMREEQHFDFLKDTILPYLAEKHKGDRSINIWSAGCSSGQEPYSVSIILKEYFDALGGKWDTRILATDLSTDMLNIAVNPTYTSESLSNIPDEWKRKYFTARPDDTWTVSPILRNNVLFRQFNLMDPIHFRKKFDLILCRNVMIYFDAPTKDALVKRFFDATEDKGYLFIGHSEGLSKTNCPYKYITPAIYRKEI